MSSRTLTVSITIDPKANTAPSSGLVGHGDLRRIFRVLAGELHSGSACDLQGIPTTPTTNITNANGTVIGTWSLV